MPRDGAKTRTTIMDAAEGMIFEQGFSATSIDRLVERVGLNKATFFYHFKTKSDLAFALVQRYAEQDSAHLQLNLDRAEDLSRDPLQQMLILIGLLREEMASLTDPIPGCLYASYCYEAQLFDDRTHHVIADAMAVWRRVLGEKLERLIEAYPPQLPVDARELTDMLLTLFEGAFILSKVYKEPLLVAEQLTHFRNYLELLFSPKSETA